MNAHLTAEVNRIRREKGTKTAKEYALSWGYEVRWDREGNIYIKDLGWGTNVK